jgi:hypothetical protein
MEDLIEVKKNDVKNVLIAINNARFNGFSLDDLKVLTESCKALETAITSKE